MANPLLIPFEPFHLGKFINRDTGMSDDMSTAHIFSNGPAYTAVVDDRIIGCAGVIILGYGIGVGWMTLSKEVEDHQFWLAKIVKKILRDIIRSFSLRQIESFILTDNDKNQLWAAFLGFQTERQYTRYVRVTR